MSKLKITKNASITTVVIDNPPANIWTIDVINEMNAFILSLRDSRDTKAVIFKSANKQFFVAHLDLNLVNGTPGGQAGCIEFSHMIKNIKTMRALSISVVDGFARGGGNEFVMACDLSYATENSAFAQPEIGINIPTGGQGGVQFSRRMGKSKALQALLTGADFTAQQAETLNIITKCVPKSEMNSFLENIISIISTRELRDITMYKEIVAVSIRDEEAGAELELRHFLERAREQKTQTIIKAFLKNGGQTEREATDFVGIFADTAADLSGS